MINIINVYVHVYIGAVAVCGSRFGTPDRAVHYSYMMCNGNETFISSCNKLTHSLEEGREIYTDIGAAGVRCHSATNVNSSGCTNVATVTFVVTAPTHCTVTKSVQATVGSLKSDGIFTVSNIVIVALLSIVIVLILIFG